MNLSQTRADKDTYTCTYTCTCMYTINVYRRHAFNTSSDSSAVRRTYSTRFGESSSLFSAYLQVEGRVLVDTRRLVPGRPHRQFYVPLSPVECYQISKAHAPLENRTLHPERMTQSLPPFLGLVHVRTYPIDIRTVVARVQYTVIS